MIFCVASLVTGLDQFGPGDEQWGENMMGGPQGMMRMPGPGFPMRGQPGPMGGPLGPPPRMMRGRGDGRGGRGRGNVHYLTSCQITTH